MQLQPSLTQTQLTNTSTDPVTEYAQSVCDGRVLAGPLVRAACKRHLEDLEQQDQRSIDWRLDKADRAIGFFADVLCLNGGEFEGLPFELEPFQKFIVGSLFGWYGADGYRRFRRAYIEIGKGNGKSPMAAGIGLYMLTADQEPRAEVYAAAAKKDQALIMFRDAVAMVDHSPRLSGQTKKYGGATPWNLLHPGSGSFFRAISSDDSQSGPRPHCGLLDEVHEHPDSTVVEMIRAGTKGRRQALIVEITNSGFDRTSVAWQHHEYSKRIVERERDDESWFAYICGLDQDDDWRDERVWIKANPNLGKSITLKYLREQVREAVGMPSKQSIVKRLNFCEWVDAESPWIDGEAWRSCEQPLVLADYEGRDCYGGLDLSGKNDLSALDLAFPREGGGFDTFSFFWTPADTIHEREERDRVPYALWRDQEHLIATPGRSIDYSYIAHQIKSLMGRFNIKAIAFDRYRIDDLERELSDLGMSIEKVSVGEEPKGGSDLLLVQHGQGYKDMHPAVETLETEILNSRLRVQKNPVMTMCSANAVLTMDPAGFRKFDKRPGKSMGRIDGIVAKAMSVRIASAVPPDSYVSGRLVAL